jgi:hypothetical protein
MVSEETSGALLMAIGGGLLMFTIEMLLAISSGSLGTEGITVDGVMILGVPQFLVFLFGFLAFLLIGYGLFSIVKAASSQSKT